MELESKISRGIQEAMKSGDTVRRDTLRNVKKYIIEAHAAGKDAVVGDAEVTKIIQKLAKQGMDSAEIYGQQGRNDLKDYELAQVAVLREYLPKMLSDSELTAEITTIIAQTGASGPGDMGKVMGVASKQLAGRAEGRDISAKVKDLLAK